MKKFHKLILESLIDSTSYEFKNDENGNIFCTFTTVDYVINVSEFNEILTFIVTDKNGEIGKYTEKEFAFELPEQYKKFKEELQKYKNKELDDFTEDQNKSKIKTFNDQVEDEEESDPNVRLSKDITVDNTLFNFKILNDLMVENYCQCIFDLFDEKENKQYYIKSLLFIKKKNSIIVKIILQDENRQNVMTMTEPDFELKFPKENIKFRKAILKFEEYFNEMK